MPQAVDAAAVQRMTDSLFIARPWSSRSSTRFWVLLVLASVIATAGVIADSTATVIGAMIVAPLMTPILAARWPPPQGHWPPSGPATHTGRSPR